MPLTYILLLIFIVSVVTAIVGFIKNVTILKVIAGVLFFVGASIIFFLSFGLNNM